MNFSTYNGQISLSIVSALASQAYGIKKLEFVSPLEFDAWDNWLGADFDIYLDQIIDTMFDEIEEDLLSVWSTNKSE